MEPGDIRLSFNEAAKIYDEVRPSYPAVMFDELFEMLRPNPAIVEVGPGTGQATKDLLARGASVHAIEIGPAMAAKLRSNLPSDRLDVTIGDFEVVNITSASADVDFSATAYHWISQRAQADRPATILRPGGLVAIVDLIQVDSPDDAGFFAANQAIYERYGQGHTGPPAPTRDAVDPKIRHVLRRMVLRLRRRPPVRLEPVVHRVGVSATDPVVLGYANDEPVRPNGPPQRHGGTHPRALPRPHHQAARRHAHDRRPALTTTWPSRRRRSDATGVVPTRSLLGVA